jgi:hypothetical protein
MLGRQGALSKVARDKRRVHLTFHGQLADQPAIWTMSQEFDLVFNIRQADLDDGWMDHAGVGGMLSWMPCDG